MLSCISIGSDVLFGIGLQNRSSQALLCKVINAVKTSIMLTATFCIRLSQLVSKLLDFLTKRRMATQLTKVSGITQA